ncbi:MAG: hypothetical protein ACI9FR_002930, partial [Cryomorphaceae bacterium]
MPDIKNTEDTSMFNNLIITLVLIVALTACSQEAEKQINTAELKQATDVVLSDETDSQSESDKANAMYERFFEESVARRPNSLTFLGRKDRADEWNDLSAEFALQTLAHDKQQLAELVSIDYAKLDAPTALSYDLLKQDLEESIEDYRWRLYSYPVNQMFGTHSGVVSLLINQHSIDSLQDAENYIARLNGVAKYFDQLIAGIKARTAANIVPPKFVFPHVIRDSKNIIKGAPFDDGEPSTLMADFSGKLDKLAGSEGADLSSEKQAELLSQATQALTYSVQPAYQKLVAHLTELETKATTDDGIWKWENGDEYYNVALKRTTTTDLTSDQ